MFPIIWHSRKGKAVETVKRSVVFSYSGRREGGINSWSKRDVQEVNLPCLIPDPPAASEAGSLALSEYSLTATFFLIFLGCWFFYLFTAFSREKLRMANLMSPYSIVPAGAVCVAERPYEMWVTQLLRDNPWWHQGPGHASRLCPLAARFKG